MKFIIKYGCFNMEWTIDMTKPALFCFFDKGRLKPVSSATETC